MDVKLRKLFGYRDTSNYSYQYEREGALAKVRCKRYKKAIIELDDSKDLAKVMEVLNQLKIKAEVAELRLLCNTAAWHQAPKCNYF